MTGIGHGRPIGPPTPCNVSIPRPGPTPHFQATRKTQMSARCWAGQAKRRAANRAPTGWWWSAIDRTPACLAESGRFFLTLGLHLGGVVGHELLRDRRRGEPPLRDLGYRRDFGGAAGDEALRELGEFIWRDAPFDHLDAALLRQLNDGAAGDAVEEAVGDRRVDLAVPDEKDVGAGAFRDAALPIQHHRVGIAFALGDVLGNGADHVQARGLRPRG